MFLNAVTCVEEELGVGVDAECVGTGGWTDT